MSTHDTQLTSEAKTLLSATIRKLRALLLEEVRVAAESAYQLSLGEAKAAASLDDAGRQKRRRLEAWLEERTRAARPKGAKEVEAERARLLRAAEKESAATFLNRIVMLRHLEALGLSRPLVVTGGMKSVGFVSELQGNARALLLDKRDPSRGYALLLQLLFDELALDMPGLFGDVGLARLFPVPELALRTTLEAFDDPRLASAWGDSTTLGWVYQYWNDPEREALDAKINGGGKIEPYEIASKTQMFTERYMVEWLLHNSLGSTWLAIGKKNGWSLDAESVLPVLDARRGEWRAKREAGEVALDALMPIEGELESHWKYYVPQPISEDAVEKAPASIREVKLLDPACGSGHFLVIAFDLLVAMHREEDRHRGEARSDRAIVEAILEDNLYGVDIDPRAIQIAAAGLFVKAKRLARDARPKRVNLVAPSLQLGKLPENDEALVRLRREVKEETGIPEALTQKLVAALAGVDHLGTLLKVDVAIDEAIAEHEASVGAGKQLALGDAAAAAREKRASEPARAGLTDKLEAFLSHHASEEDLGLRLDGEQLAAGVRFTRIVREGAYDVVVANPPYQGTSRMADAEYVAAKYPRGKADLYAAFLERGIQLARPGGISAMVTMRGWMFLGQFTALRVSLLREQDLRVIGDVDRGAFEDVADEVLQTVLSVVRRSPPFVGSIAVQPTPLADRSRDGGRTSRKRAALLAQVGRYDFDARGFEAIEGEPLIYWWSRDFLEQYRVAPKLGAVSSVRQGSSTAFNARFLRRPWEVQRSAVYMSREPQGVRADSASMSWVPYVMGASGRCWFEDLSDVVRWKGSACEIHHFEGAAIRNSSFHFAIGVAYATIGAAFAARAHRWSGVFSDKGASVFPEDIAGTLCAMNRQVSRDVLSALNPTISFQVSDVNRLPMFSVGSAEQIFATAEAAFAEHEATREASVEYCAPGGSAWNYAQAWAQRAVDRPAESPLPPYLPEYGAPDAGSFVSHSFGVVLGRFPLSGADLSKSVPDGILYLSAATEADSLTHTACAPLHAAWAEHGAAVGGKEDLRTYLRKSFFKHHKTVYENRPIYFPLSSANRTFVAWISIHRWNASTLQTLLSEHLHPEMKRLEGRRVDALAATKEPKGSGKGGAEARYAALTSAAEELRAFVDLVGTIADKGPPPLAGATPRETDAPYMMDLDDGVMVNSSALYPLLEPQWKDPKKWWKELATAQGRKDYDWSHLAARYYPARVDKKCHEDPSLAVAHKCFWRYHPARAYAWELRLQDEIGPDFLIDEPGSAEARARFLEAHATDAADLRAKEMKRRETKAAKADDDQASLDLGEGPRGEDDDDESGA